MEKKQASRVLIVDDMPINRIILSSLLASNGVESDMAEGGAQCVRMCAENDYDLILLDHRMPDVDGVDTLLKLKEMFRKAGREVPIVCHTTEDARKNINLYKAAGFADVLIKPIQPQEVSQILMTYLPEGKGRNGQDEERSRIDQELKLLPKWLTYMPGIDIYSGIEHCETAEDYMDALSVFASSIHEKADEIEAYAKAENWAMYTLRVHSLKSIARLVGATRLSEDAADLEYAGKNGKTDFLMKNTPKLLENYRKFDEKLARIRDEESESENSPESAMEITITGISAEELQDAYCSIQDFTICYDADSIRMVLSNLEHKRLPEKDAKKIDAISHALSKADWESIRNILERGEA